jgi:membrane peptidoglycan carboxypeptidase
MANKRTGQPPREVASTTKRILQIVGLVFELFGRPVLWLLFGLLSLLNRLSHSLSKLAPQLPQLLRSLAKLLGKILTTLIFIVFKLTIILFLKTLLFFKNFFAKTGPAPKKRLPSRPRKRKPTATRIRWRPILLIFLLSLLASTAILGYLLVLKDLPHPNRLISRNQTVSTKIYARNGQLLYKIFSDQNRTLVKLDELPPHLIKATIAIEDAEFYQHYGFSPRGIFRSLVKNLSEGRLQGGSTITQQLVKNALLTPERTLVRKIKEVILAVQVEMRFNKEEILQMYLNEVAYGGAAYGIEEAAWKYFAKPAKKLSLPEASLLAGLPASPTLYSPFGAHPELAKIRQGLVLKRMIDEKFISLEEGEKAKTQPLAFAPQEENIKAPHFVMYIKDLLVKEFGEQLVEKGGLEVTTSLDLSIQELAQKTVREEIKSLKRLNVQNGAALVLNPKTGEILAMVGSHDYFDQDSDGNVNVTLRPRQPGSAIKPINYAVALSLGYTPATILSDTPITYKIPGQPPYSPRNYDNRFHGRIPLRTALASSYNVPAVKILSSYGVDKMLEMGQNLGITPWTDDRPGYCLLNPGQSRPKTNS